MAFAGFHDGASDDTTSNDVTGAGISATNEWLYSHDGKCQILANQPTSHLDQTRYSPRPHQERQPADAAAVV